MRPVAFTFRSEEAVDRVAVGGDWNARMPDESLLIRMRENLWSGTILVPTGMVRYKFHVGSSGGKARWLRDSSNPWAEPDGYGSANSVMKVERHGENVPAPGEGEPRREAAEHPQRSITIAA